MRKFQRAAAVAAAVAGLSILGAGVSFAHDGGVTAVASSQANAVANNGGGGWDGGDEHHGRGGAPVFAPENGAGVSYGQDHGQDHGGDHDGGDHGQDGEGQ
ncbi:hypothetical protein ACFV98_41100 [Streptomyces violascens]|jgi:hypothetical protein|uniref:hypothetical protein n=1 Tax=Streptomyces violascens TaxID=67381 RepID=UPI003660D05B